MLLDLCTGTGDLAIELGKIGKVIGLDFCRPMLQIGARKLNRGESPDPVSFVEGDALFLPFGGSVYDAASIAFGLRNLESLEQGLSEFRRVLKPGGQLAILEFSIPTNILIRPAYLFYFTRILPLIGRIVSGKAGPYSYLPASVREFPHPPELGQILRKLGYSRVEHISLSLGIATLTIAGRD
jgi:demethylmenaquinone methyltransferase/2-methoxy-6-polyprenyl-1,4-benzoquinol methylase